MGYFTTFQSNNAINKQDVKLWQHPLSDIEFNSLVETLKFSNELNLDPRDATLFYAEWWRRNYNGGKPSKEFIFKSIGGNIQFNLDAQRFYKIAKKGAEMLGINWISKQNTLYFRTLLLQGGLPLNHISANKSNYKNFLIAVLEEQPEKIEDFIFQPSIINLLPPSSRNEIIFENCFEIVQSILKDDNFYDELFKSNETIKEITDALKIKKKALEKKVRFFKPENFWKLNTEKNKISLRLIFNEKYTSESLSQILGFAPVNKTYQFYLNDKLICTFIKMLNGDYKTDWHNQSEEIWNGEPILPLAYVMTNEEKIEVKDFIQTIPNLETPTLWFPISENNWKLVKSNGVSSEKALLLYPEIWTCEKEIKTLKINNTNVNYTLFEGEIEIINGENHKKRIYKTNVSSFDWTIISQKPNWILNSNMPIVRNKPEIFLYNEKNEKLSTNDYQIFAKYHAPSQVWQDLSKMTVFPVGCIDLKIEKDGIVAYDNCYNIGKLDVNFTNQTINSAHVNVKNNQFKFKLEENPLLNIECIGNAFSLQLNQEFFKIPNSIKASLKIGTSKSLVFDLESPFKGIELLDNEGKIINEDEKLTFKNLYGIRILTPANAKALIKMQNELRNEVVIIKESEVSSIPLISFKDELLRLYYLADAMEHKNKVKIELSSGNKSKTYYISGFTHTLDVEEQTERKVKIYNSNDELELFAIPLNCNPEQINLIPLSFNENIYKIPECEFTNQFIIISSKNNKTQLMPRYVNTEKDFIGIDKNERIENYHQNLENSDFQSDSWKELLAYFNICINHNLPFSTFDQIRSISRSSLVLARAFFFLGINQLDIDEYIQKTIPELEKDLGICFHWIKKEDWKLALNEICELIRWDNFPLVFDTLSKYFANNNLEQIPHFLNDTKPNVSPVLNPNIIEVRSKLNSKVLNGLPRSIPRVNEYYKIPKDGHQNIFLLINSPIAVAESILGINTNYPIWGGDDFREKIRRNIQYSQYLTPDFYNHIILHTLKTQN
jgi:hypothetical protein